MRSPTKFRRRAYDEDMDDPGFEELCEAVAGLPQSTRQRLVEYIQSLDNDDVGYDRRPRRATGTRRHAYDETPSSYKPASFEKTFKATGIRVQNSGVIERR